MGKRRSAWLSAVKKAFSMNHPPAPKNDQLQQKPSPKNQKHPTYINDNVSADYYYQRKKFVDVADHRNHTARPQEEKAPYVKEESVIKAARNGIWRFSRSSKKKTDNDEKEEASSYSDHDHRNKIDHEMRTPRRRKSSRLQKREPNSRFGADYDGRRSRWSTDNSSAAPESNGSASGLLWEAQSVTTTTTTRDLQNSERRAMAVAAATAAAAEAAAAAAQAAAAVATLSSARSAARVSSSASAATATLREHAAATRIQAAFRGYLVRRDMAAWRSMERMQKSRANLTGTRSYAVVHSAATTTRHAPPLQECQSEKSEAGSMIMMKKKKQNINWTLQQKRSWRGGGWDDRTLTVEEIEEREMARQEATMKRERALAYSLSHQRIRKERGWNWLERWMAARPWEREHRRESSSVTASRMIPESTHRQPQLLRQRRLAFVEESPTPSLASCRTSIPATPRRREVGIASSVTSPYVARYRVPMYGSAWSVASTPNYMVPTESARAKFRCHSTPRCRPSSDATTQHGRADEVVSRFSKAAFLI